MKMDQTTIFIVILTLFVAACFFVNMVNVPIEGMTKAPNAPKPPAKYAGSMQYHLDKYLKPKTKEGHETGSDCHSSQYGCCADGVTYSLSLDGSGCPGYACGSIYGCCLDGVTGKLSVDGSGCPGYACNSVYGCCVDQSTGQISLDGSGCPGYACGSKYGCCPDNVTGKNSSGSNCPGYACGSVYGCCEAYPTIAKTDANGSNCPAVVSTSSTSSTDVNATIESTTGSTTGSTCETYGYCSDSVTCKSDVSGTNCSEFAAASAAWPPVGGMGGMGGISGPSNTSTVFIPPPLGQGSILQCPPPEPCPACARCPEPSFDCKKVPNYSSTNSEYLPMPVLNDFSTFGM